MWENSVVASARSQSAHPRNQTCGQARIAQYAENTMERKDENTEPETHEDDETLETDADGEVIDTDEQDPEDNSDDDDADDEEDEGEEGDLGQRAQKRIKKLVGRAKDAERRVKELEAELEDAKKLGGDDAETFIAAAKSAGVLPSLMSKDLAQAIERREENHGLIAYYENWLDDEDNEELEVGGRTLTRKQVRARIRDLREDSEKLDRRWGAQEKSLQEKVRDIFELGRQAMKAGWKPGKKKPGDGAAPSAPKKKPPLDHPTSERTPARRKGGKVDWGSASGKSSLAALIQQSEKS